MGGYLLSHGCIDLLGADGMMAFIIGQHVNTLIDIF